MPKRLLIYDGTSKAGEGPLRAAWAYGATVYRALGRIDAAYGARDWPGALDWVLAQVGNGELAELQFWGHGHWGTACIAGSVLDGAALRPQHALHDRLRRLRNRMTAAASGLVWFRTCETFGADSGQEFAAELANFLQARVAGHTHVIGIFQSGLHGLLPGATPHWSPSEGIRTGTSAAPQLALESKPDLINTLHFMHGAIPDAWFG
jgi:hypothetical protein